MNKNIQLTIASGTTQSTWLRRDELAALGNKLTLQKILVPAALNGITSFTFEESWDGGATALACLDDYEVAWSFPVTQTSKARTIDFDLFPDIPPMLRLVANTAPSAQTIFQAVVGEL